VDTKKKERRRRKREREGRFLGTTVTTYLFAGKLRASPVTGKEKESNL